jgi:hypothetical protein
MRTNLSGSQSHSMDGSGNDLAISKAEWYRHALTGTMIADPDNSRPYVDGRSLSYNSDDPCWYGQTPAPSELLRQANSPISNMMESPSKNSWSTVSLLQLRGCIGLRPTQYAQALLLERSIFPNPPPKRRLSLGSTSDLRVGNGSHASLNNRDTNPARHAENSSWNVIITTIPWMFRPSGAWQHPPHQNEAVTLTMRLIAHRSNYTQHVIPAYKRCERLNPSVAGSMCKRCLNSVGKLQCVYSYTEPPAITRCDTCRKAGRTCKQTESCPTCTETKTIPCIHKDCDRCDRLKKECVWSGAEDRRALIDLCRSLPVFEAVGGEKTQVNSSNDEEGNGERGDEEERS